MVRPAVLHDACIEQTRVIELCTIGIFVHTRLSDIKKVVRTALAHGIVILSEGLQRTVDTCEVLVDIGRRGIGVVR